MSRSLTVFLLPQPTRSSCSGKFSINVHKCKIDSSDQKSLQGHNHQISGRKRIQSDYEYKFGNIQNVHTVKGALLHVSSLDHTVSPSPCPSATVHPQNQRLRVRIDRERKGGLGGWVGRDGKEREGEKEGGRKEEGKVERKGQ